MTLEITLILVFTFSTLGSRSILRQDLGLIYCRSGDLKNGLAELLEAQKLTPKGADIEPAYV